MTAFRHVPTGRTGHVSSHPGRKADRRGGYAVIWDDPYHTIGVFTGAEFHAECVMLPDGVTDTQDDEEPPDDSWIERAYEDDRVWGAKTRRPGEPDTMTGMSGR